MEINNHLKKYLSIWVLLAFQAGWVNTGGFLGVHVFVSHVTGFAGHASASILNQDFLHFLFFILIPVSFLFGAFTSGFWIEKSRLKSNKIQYTPNTLFMSFLFLLTSLLGLSGALGTFGDQFENYQDFILLFMLSYCCGMQNALFTHYSKSIIRTTHLTGLTTDLGIGLAKVLLLKDPSEKVANSLRIQIILFFLLGSVLAAYFFQQLHFYGFLIPAAFSFYISLKIKNIYL